MKRTLPLAALLALTLLAAGNPGWAQSLYQVDIIVFAATDPASRSSERWPDDPGQPETAGASKVGADVAISPKQGSLAGLWERLEISGRYRPLSYFRWRQPAGSPGRIARAVVESPVQVGKKGPAEIQGTVGVSQDGALQVDVDMLYREIAGGDGGSSAAGIKTYRLREQRRLQGGEIHYLDHAAFGVLIQVTPG